jgi:hypothetical protein
MASAPSPRPALADLVVALGDRVAPVTLAGERIVTVPAAFADLFPEGGLVRGRILTSTGQAATSLALALVAPVVAAGAWLGVVDLPAVGLDAASELGLPLERVVAIDSGGSAERWPEIMAAAIDGFDVLLTCVPTDVHPAAMRKVATRVQQRGAVVIVLGEPGALRSDGDLHSDSSGWSGVGDGHGHLRERTVVVQASGRRFPGRCRRELVIPGPSPDPGVVPEPER